MAVPVASVASSAKAVTLGGFKRRVTSFRVPSVALCDIPTCFLTCRKPFSVAGRQVVATRKFRGRRSILRHVMKIDGSLARNIDFEVANFEVHEKTRWKTSIL